MIEKNIKNKDLAKIKDEILSLKKTVLNYNFQKSTGQLEKTHQIRGTKRKIARLKMEISKMKGDNNA